MERARHFLESGLTVAATAAGIGYDDPCYVSRMFRRTLGLSRASMSGATQPPWRMDAAE